MKRRQSTKVNPFDTDSLPGTFTTGYRRDLAAARRLIVRRQIRQNRDNGKKAS